MSGHTPGPWSFDKYWRIVDPQGKPIEVTNVSLPCGHVPATHVAWANSALFVAAPDLLEALKQIIDSLPQRRDWLDPVIEAMAKDAIAKAEPKS